MSRFAKLVNAQVARERDKPAEPAERQSTDEITPEETIESIQDTEITPVESSSDEGQREPSRTSPQYLDATHTASEQRVYSVMYRETISRGVKERHFGPKELCERTGIRSDKTIRTALAGLIEKLSIAIVSNFNGNPLGPRYRIYDPKEIIARRKTAQIEIDTQSKKLVTPVATPVATGVATPVDFTGVTPVDFTGVTPVDFTGVSSIYKYRNSSEGRVESAAGSSSNSTAGADDEAYAPMLSRFRKATKTLTGRESTPAEAERWAELADLLITELKIAAGRTGSVSSVPAFLTEHLRRRLWKQEKRQLEEETKPLETSPGAEPAPDASQCPDCFGTGMFYPEGFDKGVARCAHSRLTTGDSS